MKSPTLKLSPSQTQSLAEFAPYVWWKIPEEALHFPDRLIAQIMDKGLYSDVCRLVDLVVTISCCKFCRMPRLVNLMNGHGRIGTTD